MAVSVDVAGKLVNIDAVFKDKLGSVVAAPGSATVSLTVSGGGLASPLTGTLEVTVLAMEPESVELNGTVVDAA